MCQNRCLPTPVPTDPARTVLVCRVITVPVELHPHATMFVAEDFLACRSCHDSALRAVDQRFQQRLWSPCSVCRDHRKMVLQRRPRSPAVLGTACGCSPCSSLATTCHSRFRFACGCPVSTIRRPGHISGERLHSPRGFCIVSPAVHLPAGKVLPVGTLETSGVVIHFILCALVVPGAGLPVQNVRPSRAFKGVVFGHHGRRADLCAVAGTG